MNRKMIPQNYFSNRIPTITQQAKQQATLIPGKHETLRFDTPDFQKHPAVPRNLQTVIPVID